ncbi:MAG: c-type cytochrome [Acidobacteria bacterium]|nr:c-type cytochrome [Acidobacteriota bacterium]
MKRNIKLGVVAAVLAFAAFFGYNGRTTKAQVQTPQTQGPTIGQQFKNIKVLNDVPADQLGKIMNLFSASLGVDCAFCHNTKDYSSDEKREKQTARKMIAMTFEINKANFNGRPQVSCNSCHNGHQEPSSSPNLWPDAQEPTPKQPDPKPTADQILAKYLTAVGGADKVAKITSRHLTATHLEPDGKSEPEDIWQKGRSLRIDATYPDNVVTKGYDGTTFWINTKKGGAVKLNADDAAILKRDADLMFNPDLKSVYTKLDYRFTDNFDGRPVYLVTGTLPNNQVERLGFDVETGLLVVRIFIVRTALGPFMYQWNYSDYKDFGGVKIPTTIKIAQPGVRFTRKITKVKINAPITDNSVFSEPKK